MGFKWDPHLKVGLQCSRYICSNTELDKKGRRIYCKLCGEDVTKNVLEVLEMVNKLKNVSK